MHELGIVFQVIKTVERTAKENHLFHVQAVTMELGEVSGVIQDQLINCWNWAVDRTEILKNATLDIEKIPAVTFCDDCDKTYETVKYGKVCPYCNSGQTYLLTGNEMNVKEIFAE